MANEIASFWTPHPTRAFVAGGAIREGRVVVKGASVGAVIEGATAGTVPCWGISAHAVTAAGETIDVHCTPGSVVKCEAGAAVTYGDVVTFNNAGEIIAVSAGTEYIVGVAQSTAADGGYVAVRLASGDSLYT